MMPHLPFPTEVITALLWLLLALGLYELVEAFRAQRASTRFALCGISALALVLVLNIR